MLIIALLFVSLLLPMLLVKSGARKVISWLAGSSVLPGFLVLSELFSPGSGGAMWAIAVFFGGLMGTCVAALGVLLARLRRKTT
jgi:hypothetical protein